MYYTIIISGNGIYFYDKYYYSLNILMSELDECINVFSIDVHKLSCPKCNSEFDFWNYEVGYDYIRCKECHEEISLYDLYDYFESAKQNE